MQLKEIALNENVNSDKFKDYVYGKNVIYMKGYGIRVDTQELSDGPGRIAAVIKEKFNVDVMIKFAGRFGAVVSGDDYTWQFDFSLAGSGHYSGWKPSTRGYYAMTAKTLFVFAKDDLSFPLWQMLSSLGVNKRKYSAVTIDENTRQFVFSQSK